MKSYFTSSHPLTVKLASMRKSDRLDFVNNLNQNKHASCVESVRFHKDDSMALTLDGQPGRNYYETLQAYLSAAEVLQRNLQEWGHGVPVA